MRSFQLSLQKTTEVHMSLKRLLDPNPSLFRSCGELHLSPGDCLYSQIDLKPFRAPSIRRPEIINLELARAQREAQRKAEAFQLKLARAQREAQREVEAFQRSSDNIFDEVRRTLEETRRIRLSFLSLKSDSY